MFEGICRAYVAPFFDMTEEEQWEVGDVRWGLRKCLSVRVRGGGGW